ncbi:MAG: DUF2851 family protein [Bacteroidetes bacterium]|nr:DUF2851 family protein [Bacteroidota bacterium]
MKEDFLHFVWKNRLFQHDSLVANTGEKIKVLRLGEHNFDAGPDFFNAKVEIDGTLWVGNVEIHVNASDWARHGHHKDKNYDNVILQAVYNNDTDVKRTNGEPIPTVELKFNPSIYQNYQELLQNQYWIPCQNDFYKVDPFFVKHWLHKLMIERLERKSNEIIACLEKNKNDWEETFYQFLARNFGFKTNSQPFELLAKSLPYKFLIKHKNSLIQIEAMLLGQAGLLQYALSDDYTKILDREYKVFSTKFSLRHIDGHLWKFLRLRPSNFPTIRIAQFGSLIHKTSGLFSKIIQAGNAKELLELFRVSTSPYWENHYVFNKESESKEKKLGDQAIHYILINTVVPFLFVYGKIKNLDDFKEKSLEILDQIPPESNSIVKKWEKLGIKAENAFYTQALLQLKNEYCKFRKCIQCQIGNKILKSGKV